MKGAIDQFRHGLRNDTIRSRGIFNGQGLPVPIHASEYALGELGIWARKLDCSTSGHGKRVLENVHIKRADVEALVAAAIS